MKTQRLIKIINLTVSAHPERVRLLFQKYGIAAPVTARNVFDGMISKGQAFRKDFAQIIVNGEMAFTGVGADGTATPTTPTTTGGGYNYDELLGDITSGAQTIGGLYGLFKNLFSNEEKTESSPTDAALLAAETNKVSAEQAAKTQQLIIYAVAGLAAIIIVAIIVLKRK